MSNLTTDFLCVATSGKTADGREIFAHHLEEIAESYNPETYTALIWWEHIRYRQLGRVLEVKTEKAGDKVKLFARLEPTEQLLRFNKDGIGLFSSIEIKTNFADSGKAYLVGLAITDQPASLGTSLLKFAKQEPDVINSEAEPLIFSNNESEKENRFFRRLFKQLFSAQNTESDDSHELFRFDETEHHTAETGNPEKEIFSMTKEELTAAITTAVSAAFSAQQAQNATQNDAADAENHAQQTAPTDAPTREEYNALQAKFDALETKFNALSQPHTETPNGANGINADNKFAIDFAI